MLARISLVIGIALSLSACAPAELVLDASGPYMSPLYQAEANLSEELPSGVIDQVQALNRECTARRGRLLDQKAIALDGAARSKQATSILSGLIATVGGAIGGVSNLSEGESDVPTYAGFTTAGVGAAFSLYTLFSTPGAEQLKVLEGRLEEIQGVEQESAQFINDNPAPWRATTQANWARIYGVAEGVCSRTD